MTFIVHCMAGGCIIGYRDKDDEGRPLTKRTATRIARDENARSTRLRAWKVGGAFDYFVTPVKPKRNRSTQ